jgi:hypothetical protein
MAKHVYIDLILSSKTMANQAEIKSCVLTKKPVFFIKKIDFQ